jgi:hypothetical protein
MPELGSKTKRRPAPKKGAAQDASLKMSALTEILTHLKPFELKNNSPSSSEQPEPHHGRRETDANSSSECGT